jgi:hypothetical protein
MAATETAPLFSVKRKRRFLPPIITVSVIIVLLAAVYFGLAFYFTTHFGFNTTINDANCTFRTVSEVQEMIAEQVDEYRITVSGRAGEDETIEGLDVGLSYVPDNQIPLLLAEQNPLLWPVRILNDHEDSTTLASVSLNGIALQRIIDGLDCMRPEAQVAPTDAYMEYHDGTWGVHPETLGTTLDGRKVYAAINAAMLNTSASVDLDEEDCYVPPAHMAADPEFAEMVEQWNTYVPFCVIYHIGSQIEILDGYTTMNWVVHNPDGSFAISDAAIRDWLAAFGDRHDTVGDVRPFTTATGEQIEVSGGTYGWEIDEQAEFASIRNLIATGTGETREPYYVSSAASHEQPEWGNTYIELNLTTQHMWMIKEGAVIFESDVVTGLPGRRATPPGLYSLLEKLSPTILRGDRMPDGSYEYETPVSYWMRITWGGIGFHDATWQPWFGGNLYTYNGSHGCINMPYSKARELYGLVELGLPVIAHY